MIYKMYNNEAEGTKESKTKEILSSVMEDGLGPIWRHRRLIMGGVLAGLFIYMKGYAKGMSHALKTNDLFNPELNEKLYTIRESDMFKFWDMCNADDYDMTYKEFIKMMNEEV